jgi:hypothetical protein
VERTQSGKDKTGKGFPGYSPEYIASKDFEFGGKSAGKVNLTLSSEMLNSLTLLNHKKGELTIGFERGDTRNNGVAEGNIKGTYGRKSPIPGKQRDFLGIQQSPLNEIQNEFDVSKNAKARINLERIRELLDV